MTNTVPLPPADLDKSAAAKDVADAAPLVPESWAEIRANSDIQFENIEIPPPEPVEPGWFDEFLRGIFSFLGELFAPIGQLLGTSWPVLQWVLLGCLILFVIFVALRTFGPLAKRSRQEAVQVEEQEWQPDREESLALLEDADKLAADGHYDEATHLLLKRSVGQIAAARPDWVEPSSTARELAALPSLSEAARAAFATISSRVERSLFALRALDRSDWEVARSAYADFALARIDRESAAA